MRVGINELSEAFAEHGNIMTTAELRANNLYYDDVQWLVSHDYIEKVRHGYYSWTQASGTNEAALILKLFPGAVLCMETALFYYGYSDRNTREWNICVDKNLSRDRLKVDYPFIRAYRTDASLLHIGETKGEMNGISVKIYDRDRTICDVLRRMKSVDAEIFNSAIQRYVQDSKKNITNLMEYAQIFRVKNRVNQIIGVWL